MSGQIEVAKQIIRRDVLANPLCVTIEPTTYIYAGGEESGFVVGLLNYPRFPSTQAALDDRAEYMARELLDGTHQHSALIQSPFQTVWITRRAGETDGQTQ
jgi:hypothetical protein